MRTAKDIAQYLVEEIFIHGDGRADMIKAIQDIQRDAFEHADNCLDGPGKDACCCTGEFGSNCFCGGAIHLRKARALILAEKDKIK